MIALSVCFKIQPLGLLVDQMWDVSRREESRRTLGVLVFAAGWTDSCRQGCQWSRGAGCQADLDE